MADEACPRCMIRAGFFDADSETTAMTKSTFHGDPTAIKDRLGSYEIVEQIARGGMGVVYRARQRGLNRDVAVKVIAGGALAGAEFVQRFRTEAEAAARLSHPNIVAIYEVGDHDGHQFFSMEFVDGPNLAVWAKEHPLTPDEAANLVRVLAEAVHYAHQRGVLHRDLKPQNILMDSNGVPHITDFGLAKQSHDDRELTVTGTGFGTPGYAAPEQAAGWHDRVGPHSDLYSLGAILYFLLTTQPPHQASTAIEAFRMTLETPPLPPSRLRPQTPAELETICLTCLEKRPDLRYPSALSLAEDLARFTNREPIHARPASPFWRLWSRAQTHPWVITGLFSIAQLAVVGIAYGLWQKTHLLQWKLDHPHQPLPPGRYFLDSAIPASLAIYFCILAGYLPLKDIRIRLVSAIPFDRRQLLTYLATGVMLIVIGVVLMLKWIHAWVWSFEHNWRFPVLALLPTFGCFWFGSILSLKSLRSFYQAWRNADAVTAQIYGSPVRGKPVAFLAGIFGSELAAALLILLWPGVNLLTKSQLFYAITNSALAALAFALWRSVRDETGFFWIFMMITCAALSAEIFIALPGTTAAIAAAIGAVCAVVMIRVGQVHR